MLCHGLQRWFHISEKHVIPTLWQPGAATWEKATREKKTNLELVHCGYCKANSLLNVLWGYLGRPIEVYRLLPQDRQILGNPFAWFNGSVGEKMVCNLSKCWKCESQKHVKCQKGTGRTLHLYEMGVISLPEVITIAPLMEMHNYWKQLINFKSSRVARSSYLNHLLCLTQLSCSSSSITFYKRISKTCCTYRPSHVGQPSWVLPCFKFLLANKTHSELSLLILQDAQARYTCSC